MAKLGLKDFSEAMPQELELFSLPPTQVAVSGAYMQEIRPISTLTSDDSPCEFRVATSNSLDYLDLKNSLLYAKVKIVKSDGKPLEVGDKVGPVNLFLQSLFSTTEVTLQNKWTMICNNNPFTAMINELLKSGEDCNLSQMTSQLFIKDDYDAITSPATDGGNSGLVARTAYFALSKAVDMCGSIYHPIFSLDRYLLNQVDVKLKLNRTPAAFSLMSNVASPDYKIELLDICLLVRKIRVNSALVYGHSEALKQGVNAKYPLNHTECRMMSCGVGLSSFFWDAVFQGNKPARVVIGFVDAAAVSGAYKKNPFVFENCDISEITLYADGLPVGGAPIKLNFDKTQGQTIARAYAELFMYKNKWGKDSGNDISREDFIDGNTLFAFQLEPFYDGQNGFMNLTKTGNVRLHAQFSKPLTKTMTCIIYSESPSYFEINEARDIIATT